MAAKPIHAPVLLGMGIDELSMNPQSIPVMKNLIRSIGYADTKKFMRGVLQQTSAQAVTEMIRENYGELISETIYPE